MTIKKKIKASSRGLTFSFEGFGDFMPGKKYRYLLDKDVKKLLIVPVKEDEKGMKVSRKLCNGKVMSLFDLRSKVVRDIMERAKYLEVEISEEKIIVSAYQEVMEKASDNIILLEKHLEQIGAISVSKTVLKAAGCEGAGYYQFSLADYLEDMTNSGSFSVEDQISVKSMGQDISQVLKVISLFSGAGMLDCPFVKDSNFSIVYAAEYDPDAVKTYRENIGDHIHQLDIRGLKGNDLPDADIIIGGPPCQPYSRANPSKEKRGEYHEEGDMLKEYVRLIKEKHPKLFLIENVPQFLTDSYGENMKYILNELRQYDITSKVVRDSDVGGYSKRNRTFIIGSRIGKVQIPDLVVRPVKTAGEAIQRVNESWKNYRDVTLPSEMTKLRISLVPEGGNWKDLPEELQTKGIHSNMYRRLDRNMPSVTICNWRKYLLSPPRYDDSGNWDRILTIAEAASLSGFNEDFVFQGKLSSMQQQVGNGVPFALGKFIKNVIRQAFGLKKEPLVAST